MADRPVEQMTLRDVFTESERTLRELIEHFEQHYQPRIYDLEKVVRLHSNSAELGQISDMTVRNQAAEALRGHEYARPLLLRLRDLLEGVDRGVQRTLGEKREK